MLQSNISFVNRQSISLKINFLWIFVGNIIFAACQWGMVILIAKLGSTAMVGQFTLGLAITAPIMLLADLKLRDVQATDARHEYQFSDYLTLRIITIIASLCVISFLIWWIGYRGEKALIVLMLGLAKGFDSFSDILYGFLQQQEQMKRIALSRIIQGIIQLSALGVVLIFTQSLFWGTVAFALGSGIVTVAYDIQSVRLVHGLLISQQKVADNKAIVGSLLPRWNREILSKLFMLALPLGIAVMLGSLWINIPRYLIAHFLGEFSLGIFAAMAALLTVGGTVIGALGQTSSPRLAKYYSVGDIQAFDRIIAKLIIIGIIIGLSGLVIAIYAGDFLLRNLYNSEYSSYKNVLVWLMAASAIQFAYNFLGTGLQAMRNFRIHLPVQTGTCIIVFLLSYLLIIRHGLVGAAWAMLGANLFAFITFLLTFFYIRRNYNQVIANYD